MSLHSKSIAGSDRAPVTLRTIRQMAKAGEPFASVACYDATTARWVERGGVHVIIVGDSAAQLVLGFESTIHMPLDVAIALTAGVKRGAPSTLVMADMPFMSYHASEDEAVRNAGRFMTEGLADIVKLEVDATWAPLVTRMARAGIPICAHIGLKPQHAALVGGYSAAGRTPAEAEQVVRDAVALEKAGAVMLLLEAAPELVAERIMAETSVPLIGIGAGPACHGQVLVLADLLGLSDSPPRFATALAAVGPEIQRVSEEWVARVARREVTDHRYAMKLGDAPTRTKG